MSLVRSFAGLIIARVFLGMMEAGYFPGVAFYLTNFYKRDELAFRIAIFFSMATLAGAFGGILAYGIGFIKGVGIFKHSWHWIFIIGKDSLYKLTNFRWCLDGNCQSDCPSFHSRRIYFTKLSDK